MRQGNDIKLQSGTEPPPQTTEQIQELTNLLFLNHSSGIYISKYSILEYSHICLF